MEGKLIFSFVQIYLCRKNCLDLMHFSLILLMNNLINLALFCIVVGEWVLGCTPVYFS